MRLASLLSPLSPLVFIALGTAACAASAESLTPVASFGSNPGHLAMYEHLPPGAETSTPMPLILVLHGCTQDRGYAEAVGLVDLADAHGVALVVAEQSAANNQNKCFNWFQSDDATRGSGEALSLKQMVDSMKARHAIDERRVFVTGLSAGAAMTAVMLATYPDVFSAGAIFAGIPFGCASSMSGAFTCMYTTDGRPADAWADLVVAAAPAGNTPPRVSIWAGDADTTVMPVNADELVAQWTAVHGLSTTPSSTESLGSATHARFGEGAAGLPLVESVRIPGMTHGTPVDPATGCGTAGAFVLDVGLCGSARALAFFGLIDGDAATPTVGEGEGEGGPPPPGEGAGGEGEGEGEGEGDDAAAPSCAPPGAASALPGGGCTATGTSCAPVASFAAVLLIARRRRQRV